MKLSLNDYAEFTWDFGQNFLLEVNGHFFIWSSPDYNGDNTIRRYLDNPADFTSPGFMGRCKGKHFISDYCGVDVKIIDD